MRTVQPENSISSSSETGFGSSVSKDDVTIILPVLDEEEAIGLVIEELREEGFDNILVIDGYSTDDTVKLAEEKGVKVVMQHGSGKTGALKTAFDYVETPYLLVMDGDYTYSAKDIERFLPHATRFEQILGCRRDGRVNMGRLHRLGNWVINKALKTIYGTSITDVCTGMYMMKTDVAKKLELNSSGFDVEVETAIQNLVNGEITEVPISYRSRLGKKKLSTWKHGFQILWTVIGMGLSYNPIFFLSGLGSLLSLPGGFILFREFYLRLIYGESGWSIGYVWLGLILFITGLQCFTISILTLLSKRQERRIIQQIKALLK